MSAIDDMVNECVERISDLMDQVREIAQWLEDSIFIPPAWSKPFSEGIIKILVEITPALDEIKLAYAERGSPLAIRSAANTWELDIATRLKDVWGNVAAHKLEADSSDLWTGLASEAYKDALTSQPGAVDALAKIALSTKELLYAIADELDSYWTTLWVACGLYIAALGAGVALGATGAGAPAAIGAMIAATGGFVSVIASAQTSFLNVLAKRRQEMRALKSDDTYFDKGVWPEPSSHPMNDWKHVK